MCKKAILLMRIEVTMKSFKLFKENNWKISRFCYFSEHTFKSVIQNFHTAFERENFKNKNFQSLENFVTTKVCY